MSNSNSYYNLLNSLVQFQFSGLRLKGFHQSLYDGGGIAGIVDVLLIMIIVAEKLEIFRWINHYRMEKKEAPLKAFEGHPNGKD